MPDIKPDPDTFAADGLLSPLNGARGVQGGFGAQQLPKQGKVTKHGSRVKEEDGGDEEDITMKDDSGGEVDIKDEDSSKEEEEDNVMMEGLDEEEVKPYIKAEEAPTMQKVGLKTENLPKLKTEALIQEEVYILGTERAAIAAERTAVRDAMHQNPLDAGNGHILLALEKRENALNKRARRLKQVQDSRHEKAEKLRLQFPGQPGVAKKGKKEKKKTAEEEKQAELKAAQDRKLEEMEDIEQKFEGLKSAKVNIGGFTARQRGKVQQALALLKSVGVVPSNTKHKKALQNNKAEPTQTKKTTVKKEKNVVDIKKEPQVTGAYTVQLASRPKIKQDPTSGH
ncbi:hypothetical protein BDZ45DRAFT_743317 [Acephala macrosclerotiorum]|nr:hypothetical protein BDZ45DRAFT_743317 [Acephala macrosclerotiorum]